MVSFAAEVKDEEEVVQDEEVDEEREAMMELVRFWIQDDENGTQAMFEGSEAAQAAVDELCKLPPSVLGPVTMYIWNAASGSESPWIWQSALRILSHVHPEHLECAVDAGGKPLTDDSQAADFEQLKADLKAKFDAARPVINRLGKAKEMKSKGGAAGRQRSTTVAY